MLAESSTAVLGALYLIHCGLWIVATISILELGCYYTLFWVLLLSCFGHVRAKNNSVLHCGLEL